MGHFIHDFNSDQRVTKPVAYRSIQAQQQKYAYQWKDKFIITS